MKRHSVPGCAKIFSLCCRLILLSLLLTAACAAALALYLKQRPEELAALLTREIEERSGLAVRMRSVGVAFFPRPVLELVDVEVRGAGLTLSAPYATIWPHLVPLARGEFLPDEISLFRTSCFIQQEQRPDAEDGPRERADSFLLFSSALVELAVQETEQTGVSLRGRVQGTVPARGVDLPLQARFAAKGTRDAFTVEELELHLADDRFKFAGLFEQGGGTPAFSGKLEFERFSLPRYFAFARHLPPGIQHSLDRLHGSAVFRLDGRSLAASVLRCVTSHGTIFTGKGEMRFSPPEFFLDVQSLSVNVDEEVPEIIQSGEKPPDYGHEPLIGAPGSSPQGAWTEIGYDIRIRAAQALVASTQARELALRCSPGTKGTLLDLDARALFGGQVQGSLAVSGEEEAPWSYALKLRVQNMDLKSTKKLLPTKNLLEGTVSGNLDVQFTGDSLKNALSSLGGSFSLRLEEGWYVSAGAEDGAAKQPSPLPACTLAGTFRSRAGQGERLDYAGKWQLGVQGGDWQVDASLDGPLSIAREGFFPLRLSRVPGTLQLRRTQVWRGYMPQGLQTECSGRFSFDSEGCALAVEDAGARLFDCDLAGQMRGAYARGGFTGQGNIRLKGANLRQSLARLGVENLGLNPALLKAFSGTAAVAVESGKLALSEMEGQIDDSRFSGSLEGQWAQRPVWRGNVRISVLDLSSYLDSGPAPKKAKAWDMKFLQGFDAGGAVEIQHLRLPGVHLRQVRGPVRLDGGVLEFPSIAAELYGGPVTARLRLGTGEALDIQVSAQASRVDLRTFSDEWGADTACEGSASVQLELAGVARSGADIPAGLNGRFSCETGSGSLRIGKKTRKEEASSIRFDKIVISGPVKRGVFRSERFQLDGPLLQVRGGGWVSMPGESLDLQLEVRKAGLPAFPVRVYGKIDKPQTSVQAGQALINAVGKLGLGVMDGIGTVGSGLLDVVGGVLSAPFKLLK